MILLDTHIVLWLAANKTDRITAKALQAIDIEDVAISPMAELEMAYLREIGRITGHPDAIVGDLSTRIGLRVDQVEFGAVCAAAISQTWTRDPFDRLQAAHAIVKNIRFVTKDEVIRANLPLALWD